MKSVCAVMSEEGAVGRFVCGWWVEMKWLSAKVRRVVLSTSRHLRRLGPEAREWWIR